MDKRVVSKQEQVWQDKLIRAIRGKNFDSHVIIDNTSTFRGSSKVGPIVLFCFFAVTVRILRSPSPQQLTKNQNTKLSCAVEAFPAVTLSWKKDGELVTNDSRHVITRSVSQSIWRKDGEVVPDGSGYYNTTSKLTILQTDRTDIGEYQCVASNLGSSRASNPSLVVVKGNLNV